MTLVERRDAGVDFVVDTGTELSALGQADLLAAITPPASRQHRDVAR